MDQKFYDAVERNPVIAAVKDKDGLNACCALEDIQVIFVLFGDICSIGDITRQIKEAGKVAMVHVDLIVGLGGKEIALDFIRNYTQADGIITTKPSLIKRAKELSLYTILRFFVIDSMALENLRKVNEEGYLTKPDFIEILPGVMPKILRRIVKSSRIPVIAGGLIADKEDVMMALSANVIAVSTTNTQVWKM